MLYLYGLIVFFMCRFWCDSVSWVCRMLCMAVCVCVADVAWGQGASLSRFVRERVEAARVAGDNGMGARGALGVERRMTVLVRTDDVEAVDRVGGRVLASWGDIHAAVVPVCRIGELAAMPRVVRIEAGACNSVTNDTTAHIVGVCASPRSLREVEDVRNGYGLTGRGVVVGVMDIGFDLTHPNFYSRDGENLRIKAVWDQLDLSDGGVAPPMFADEDTAYCLGRVYDTEEAVVGKGASADIALSTHGTHTLGSAAGSGLGGVFSKALDWEYQYGGMAPGADICLVANMVGSNKRVVPEEMWDLYTTATDLLGFKYIFDYAESVGKPCVINLSEGSREDMFDNVLYCEVLERMTGRGRILCASAGNEGTTPSFVYKARGVAEAGAFLDSDDKSALYTLASPEPVSLRLTFYPPGGERVVWEYDTSDFSLYEDSVLTECLSFGKDSVVVMMGMYRSCFDEEQWATELLVRDTRNSWLGCAALPVSLTLLGEDNVIGAYASGGYFAANELDGDLDDFTYDHNILFPGSAEASVCVGITAHMRRRENLYGNLAGMESGSGGVVSQYSSKGPTMSGLIKPDVVAPGINVVSSYSRQWLERQRQGTGSLPQNTNALNVSAWGEHEYPWALNSGSSMSCPVVTGIVALWLEACPWLSPDDVKEVIAHSCRRGDSSLLYPNSVWGWGEIDALAGLRYINEHFCDVVEVVGSRGEGLAGEGVVYDLSGRRVDSSVGHGVFVCNGSLVCK